MGGYETYLAAAFTKKHVPLIAVADKDKTADSGREAVLVEEIMHSCRNIPIRVDRGKSYTLGVPGDQPRFEFGPG
jgi:hypothetical protein